MRWLDRGKKLRVNRPLLIKKSVLLAVMYTSQSLPLGFTWVALPIIMRRNGYDLQSIGMLALLYLPWAGKFIYASVLDRYYFSSMGKRRSWILPLQGLASVLLFLLAICPNTAGGMLPALVLIFTLNLVVATCDIAVAGYAADMLEPEDMHLGGMIQTFFALLGTMLGGGVLFMAYDLLGWQNSFLLLGILALALSLPVLFHTERDLLAKARQKTQTLRHKPSLFNFATRPEIKWFLFFMFWMAIVSMGGSQLFPPMMNDLGLSPAQIGSIMFWWAHPAGLAGSFIGGPLMRYLGVRNLVRAASAAAIILCWQIALVAKGHSIDQSLAAVLLMGQHLMQGIVMTCMHTLMIRLSAGPQAATNHGFLCGFNHVVMLTQAPLEGWIGNMFGYAGLYATLSFVLLFSLFAADWTLKARLRSLS